MYLDKIEIEYDWELSMKKPYAVHAVLTNLCLVFCVILQGCGSKPVPADASGKGIGGGHGGTPTIAIAVATTADVPITLTALGTAIPATTVTVRAQVDGALMRILFQEGQIVRKGQLLAEIDPRTFQAQYDQARGQYARDHSQLANAQLDMKRFMKLNQQGWVTGQQVDTQSALVRQLEGTLIADQAQITSARVQLGYTRIVAPSGGRVGLRQIDQGNIIHASDPAGLVVLTETHPIDVQFTLPQDIIGTVARKFQAHEVLPAVAFNRGNTAQLATGILHSIDNQIDTTTGTVKLKARFANQGDVLFPNQFVNVRLQLAVLHKATTVPVAAVQNGQPGTFVYVLNEDSTVQVRKVVTGPVDGDRQVIAHGINLGETVVTDGLDKLKDGAKVRTLDAKAMMSPDSPGSSHHHRRHGG